MYRSSKLGFMIMRGLMSLLIRLSNLTIKLKNFNDEMKKGDIFLFNHFIRAETALPQYLLYCADTSVRSFAVAHSSFFKVWWLGPLLRRLGAVPHDHPELMELLITKLSEGYKIVIFPQGKMVKDQEAMEMRTGAAVLAMGTEVYKQHIRDNPDDYSLSLLEFAMKSTTIVPCNISYYPLRVSPNKLTKLGEDKHLPEALVEEMTVEGNMFIHDTTMTLNFSEPFEVDSSMISTAGVTDISTSLRALSEKRDERFKVRDRYREDIYGNLSIHMGHIFSEVLFTLCGDNNFTIKSRSYRSVSQDKPNTVALHSRIRRSVELSCGVLGVPFSEKEYKDLIEISTYCNLISTVGGNCHILEKLREEQPFQLVRLENPISVYRSELSSMKKEVKIISDITIGPNIGEGFVLVPKGVSKGSVLILHGLYATADQCRMFGERLRRKGYRVHAPLIAGHGTSAEDLRTKTHEDWYRSVADNLPKGKFHIVGFSTGGLIAARICKELQGRVLSFSCICAPQKFIHGGVNFAKIVRKMGFPKYWNNGSNPDTYDKIPVSSVCELKDLISLSKDYFPSLVTPTLVTQTTNDPIVDPTSGPEILRLLPNGNARLSVIDSDKHDIDSSEDDVIEFIGENSE